MFGAHIIANVATNLSYKDTEIDHTDLSSYTFSSKSIGDAHSKRFVVVSVGFVDISTSMSVGDGPSSVTIGGVSATLIQKASEKNGSGYLTGASLWIAQVPTGATADVVVNFSETVSNCAVMVYRLVHATGTPLDSGSAQHSSNTPITISSLAYKGAGVAMGAGRDNTGSSGFDLTWGGTANPSEDKEYGAVSYNSYESATLANEGTVSLAYVGNETLAVVAATW